MKLPRDKSGPLNSSMTGCGIKVEKEISGSNFPEQVKLCSWANGSLNDAVGK